MKPHFAIVVAVVFTMFAALAHAQGAYPPTQPAKLADLLNEAERNNLEIQAARQRWDASKQVPSQVSTLPDPEVMVQQLNVGSPRPFAGYTNSDFAYVGLGFSQDIPYPGKLRLRGDVARADAEVAAQEYESVRRAILSKVKQAYFRLSYLAEKAAILESDQDLLRQVVESAEARYRSGGGSQQDVLQAQIEQTKLLREITENQLEIGTFQAVLKQLLNRSQTSPDIRAAGLSETPLTYNYNELLSASRANNSNIARMRQMVQRQKLEVKLAKKDFDPDFNLQYMWQRTDPSKFRAYYMVTFGVRVPIHRARLHAELGQARAEESGAQSDYHAEIQQVASDLQRQFLTAGKSGELLKIYRDGLLPQARAELQAGMAAYAAAREDFQALLASFLDVLSLDEQYWQTLDEHETALAGIEQTTGLSLR